MAKSLHSEEFKAQVLKEVKEIHNVAFVARKHNIPAHRIRHWMKKAEPVSDLQKEKKKVKQLEKELYETNLELEILKALLKKSHQREMSES